MNTNNALLVVPAFNEEKRLHPTNFLRLCRENELDILFIDDGSTDQTVEILKSLSSTSPNIKFLSLEYNSGKSNAIWFGFRNGAELGYRYVGFVDSDSSCCNNDIINGLGLILSDPDLSVVSGARVLLAGSNIQRSNFRKWISRIMATVLSIITKTDFYDPQSPCKWYRVDDQFKAVLGKNPQTKWFGELELVINLIRLRPLRSFPLKIQEFALSEWSEVANSKLTILHFPSVIKQLYTLLRISRVQ